MGSDIARNASLYYGAAQLEHGTCYCPFRFHERFTDPLGHALFDSASNLVASLYVTVSVTWRALEQQAKRRDMPLGEPRITSV